MSRSATRRLSLSPTADDAGRIPVVPAGSLITVVVARFGGVIDFGLARLLDGALGLHLLASGLEFAELETTVAESRPHVVVLSDAEPDVSVFDRLRQARPGLGLVVLGHRFSYLHAVRLLAMGANACVTHEAASLEVMSAAVRIASEGGRMLAVGGENRADDRLLRLLTPREAEVFGLLCDGHTNAEVAAALTISVETARKHAQRVRGKLGISGSRQLRMLSAVAGIGS